METAYINLGFHSDLHEGKYSSNILSTASLQAKETIIPMLNVERIIRVSTGSPVKLVTFLILSG